MAATILSATAGQANVEGDIVEKVFGSQTNDATHVCTNPDQGRIQLFTPEGTRYTSVASFVASSSAPNQVIANLTLIKQTQ